MDPMPAVEMHATIPASAAHAALSVAARAVRLRMATEAAKRARAALREAIKRTDEWNESDGLKAELAKATQETRKAIAEWCAKARRHQSCAALAAAADEAATGVRLARQTLDDMVGEHGEQLLLFAREVESGREAQF